MFLSHQRILISDHLRQLLPRCAAERNNDIAAAQAHVPNLQQVMQENFLTHSDPGSGMV